MLKHIKNNRGLLTLVLCMALFRTAVADWSPVPSSSMEPTIYPGDVILVDKTILGPAIPFTESRLFATAQPQRGDIITFTPPHVDDTYVKRVIGLPGDRIRTEGLRVSVNGEWLPLTITDVGEATGLLTAIEIVAGREHAIQVDTRRSIRQLDGEIVVPANAYFVMGDFRNLSADSREWGFVQQDKIIGRATRVMVSIAAERSLFGSIGDALQ